MGGSHKELFPENAHSTPPEELWDLYSAEEETQGGPLGAVTGIQPVHWEANQEATALLTPRPGSAL